MTKQRAKQGKAIKPLTQKAEKGILLSQFQLHEDFSKGQNVSRDEETARKYLQMLENTLAGKNIRLKSLRLSAFRRFQNLDIDFDERLTVIIGDNGAGKTSVAEALSKIFSWLNNNIEKDNAGGKPIVPLDINVRAVDYAEITGRFQLDKTNTFDASLARVVSGFTGSQSSSVSVIKQIGAMYRKTAHNPKIMIPLLAFYSVERSCFTLRQKVSEKASGEITSNRFSALHDALEGDRRFDNFSERYIELVNLAEGEETKEAKSLKVQIDTLEEIIRDEGNEGRPPAESPLLATLNAKKEELAGMLRSAPSAKFQRHLSFVNHAIETLVPDVSKLRVDRSSGKAQLLVENFGNKVNITQLSQGQKTMVALACDLARRLVTLNPESDSPLHCHGIVVIEIGRAHV